MQLAPYASAPNETRGRLITEPSSPTRSDHQRDRDRIIHSHAFRRLKHKTQVFIYHEGDHYRTRLTHSLEVAQVARSIARALWLNEDLAEAIALAHDLGHPPFGHTGEDALKALMVEFGGFDHNAQSLSIVTALEKRYATFDGLNLSWETLEGLVKHNGPLLETADAPRDNLPPEIADYDRRHDLWLHTHASLEAQIAAIADDIAYDGHDIDDGLRAGILTLDQLRDVPLVGRAIAEVDSLYPGLEAPRRIHEVLRRVLTWPIENVITEARHRLDALQPESADDVRRANGPLAVFSSAVAADERALKDFLFAHLYRHPKIMEIRMRAQGVVKALFTRYLEDPAALPDHDARDIGVAIDTSRARAVADFVAGMTDRFAIQEHRRLFGDTPPLR